MHVRREARLVDDHRCGVELSLAPTPVQSSQKNRPDAPYEGLPPNRWMPGTNAKCPRTHQVWAWVNAHTRRVRDQFLVNLEIGYSMSDGEKLMCSSKPAMSCVAPSRASPSQGPQGPLKLAA